MINRWQRGYVDTNSEHFELLVAVSEEDEQTEGKSVAVIGPPEDGSVNVSFLIEENEANASLIEKVEKEINFYLLEINEPDRWKYAQYHCGTASNVYSSVHWSFVEAGSKVPQKDPDNSRGFRKRMTELELDHLFWNEISTNLEFRSWFLHQTKFAALTVDLVVEEKWHQRWYKDPITGKDSETDILLLFRSRENSDRYAIHIENKPAHGKWEPFQPENYRKRAMDRMSKWQYVEFQTVLIAPLSVIERSPLEIGHFDITISYEDISKFVPPFGVPV
jgi:hypothetical protein